MLENEYQTIAMDLSNLSRIEVEVKNNVRYRKINNYKNIIIGIINKGKYSIKIGDIKDSYTDEDLIKAQQEKDNSKIITITISILRYKYNYNMSDFLGEILKVNDNYQTSYII